MRTIKLRTRLAALAGAGLLAATLTACGGGGVVDLSAKTNVNQSPTALCDRVFGTPGQVGSELGIGSGALSYQMHGTDNTRLGKGDGTALLGCSYRLHKDHTFFVYFAALPVNLSNAQQSVPARSGWVEDLYSATLTRKQIAVCLRILHAAAKRVSVAPFTS